MCIIRNVAEVKDTTEKCVLYILIWPITKKVICFHGEDLPS